LMPDGWGEKVGAVSISTNKQGLDVR